MPAPFCDAVEMATGFSDGGCKEGGFNSCVEGSEDSKDPAGGGGGVPVPLCNANAAACVIDGAAELKGVAIVPSLTTVQDWNDLAAHHD